MAVNKYLLIITLNIKGLNAPIKRHRTAEWIRNCLLYTSDAADDSTNV